MTEEDKINQILGRFFIDGTKGDYLDALQVAVEKIQQLKNCNLQNVSGSAYRDELIKKTESMEEFAKQNYDHKEYYEGLINGLRNMRAHIKTLYIKHYR